jgi:large subunit ribosomal protein L31
MKQGIHPTNYRPVVFQDLNDGTQILTRSTVEAEETITLDGVEYPLVKVHISSSSHPFFTGEERIVDIEGRVDKFKARREAGEKAKAEKAAKAPKSKAKKAKSEAQKLGTAPAPKARTETKQALTEE